MTTETSLLGGFAEHVKAKNPIHASFLDGAVAQLRSDERDDLERYLAYCVGHDLDVPYLAEAYNTIVNDTLMEQIHFRRTGSYRHSTFKEVADAVYFNDEYMRRYMYGLAITSFLWPNHAAMHRFFLETLPRKQGGRYLEVGPGHGFFFMKAMELSGCDDFTGVDISRTSLDMTAAIVGHYDDEAPAALQLIETDFLKFDRGETGYDTLVMGEVLEHVEQPVAFVRKLAELANPGAHVYVTTCLNAPAVDHIYLFPDVPSVESMLTGNGFTIEQRLLAPYAGKTVEECVEQRLAVNVAYALSPSA